MSESIRRMIYIACILIGAIVVLIILYWLGGERAIDQGMGVALGGFFGYEIRKFVERMERNSHSDE